MQVSHNGPLAKTPGRIEQTVVLFWDMGTRVLWDKGTLDLLVVNFVCRTFGTFV